MKVVTPEDLRRIDAETAEKVMGWRDVVECGCSASRLNGLDPNTMEIHHVPQYTTDPAASKQLRDKLAEQWDWLLGCGTLSTVEPPYGFGLMPRLEKRNGKIAIWKHIAEADTEELAIALCALKSVGVEVEL